MRGPVELAGRALRDMEDRWLPYSDLWWRLWTPKMSRGDRYQNGYFNGYPLTDLDDDESVSDLPIHDIRRLLANPVIRSIYRKLPYIHVDPVVRPYDTMDAEQRRQREQCVVECTLEAYRAGKAFYPRWVLESIEDQMDAAKKRLSRRKRRCFKAGRTLISYCKAPNSMWVAIPALDGVTVYVRCFVPGAKFRDEPDRPLIRRGWPEYEFRSLQELAQPDPLLEHIPWKDVRFLPDSWTPSIGYQPINLISKVATHHFFVSGFDSALVGAPILDLDGMRQRLKEMKRRIRCSEEWRALVRGLDISQGHGGEILRHVDKVVFFYGNGFCEHVTRFWHNRAMTLFAMAMCLREWVQALGGRPVKRLPIFVPTYDYELRTTWNGGEGALLRENGATLIDSTGRLYLLVDENTIVVSYRYWNPVKQVVADLARPAAIICRTVSEKDDDLGWVEEQATINSETTMVRVPKIRSREVSSHSMKVDPDSPRVRKMVQDYDRFDILELPRQPEEEEEPMSLYIRKPGASTKVEYW
ncbi:hypothetical protein VTJ49DRAFT_3099 [Mycothermus thermophilus]|uniref:Uncharacterized protein n=1 Tax=Humicola insolens TaxID=85995 RepID=A0ABR3V9J3_HUMIN